jgi:S1-C subfamily serine protease
MGRVPRPEPSRPSLWVVAGVSALSASLLSTGLVIAATALFVPRHGAPVEREMVARPVGTGVSADEEVVRIAERVRPAIAQVKLDRDRTGSGVVFRSDGHVLTSAHVVAGATTVTVALPTGREVPARVVGSDPHTDIAVVKVEGGGFSVAIMGTATGLAVGQKAVAVGSPLSLAGPSVTVGVISALHRNVRSRSDAQPMYGMVQTDAAIAPASSGGALLDSAGSVIGITTTNVVGEGGAEGVGFAVPIDVARSVAEQLMTAGRVANVWIGIQGQDVDGATASQMDVHGGAVVADVKPGSPAERAGVAPSDVIVAVNGRPITSMGELVVALRLQKPGSAVTLDVLRERRRHTMTVTVAERPPNT